MDNSNHSCFAVPPEQFDSPAAIEGVLKDPTGLLNYCSALDVAASVDGRLGYDAGANRGRAR